MTERHYRNVPIQIPRPSDVFSNAYMIIAKLSQSCCFLHTRLDAGLTPLTERFPSPERQREASG